MSSSHQIANLRKQTKTRKLHGKLREGVRAGLPDGRPGRLICLFSSIQSLSCGLQQARPPYPSPTPGTHSNSCPLCRWWHPTISCPVIPFSSCFQSFPASRSFPMSWFFTLGSQSIGVSASASVLPRNIQDWFPLGLNGFPQPPSHRGKVAAREKPAREMSLLKHEICISF